MRQKVRAALAIAASGALLVQALNASSPANAAVDYQFSTGSPVDRSGAIAIRSYAGIANMIKYGLYPHPNDPDAVRNVIGSAHFLPDYEHFGPRDGNPESILVRDEAPDGRRIGVQWHTADGQSRGLCVNKDGFNDWAAGEGGRVCTIRFPEGKRVLMRIGHCNDTETHPCGGPETWPDYIDNWAWERNMGSNANAEGWVSYTDDEDDSYFNDCYEYTNDCP